MSKATSKAQARWNAMQLARELATKAQLPVYVSFGPVTEGTVEWSEIVRPRPVELPK